jgi:hypothetical protein
MSLNSFADYEVIDTGGVAWNGQPYVGEFIVLRHMPNIFNGVRGIIAISASAYPSNSLTGTVSLNGTKIGDLSYGIREWSQHTAFPTPDTLTFAFDPDLLLDGPPTVNRIQIEVTSMSSFILEKVVCHYQHQFG